MRKTLKAARRVLAMALVLLLLSTSALAASYGAKVLVRQMSVYDYPAGSSKLVKVGALGRNTGITVTGINGQWIRFKYKGNTYYADIDDVVFNKRYKATMTKDAHIRFVTKKSYRRNTYYNATITAGTTVYICGKDGSKLLVANRNGSALGYVSASCVKRS